MPRNLLIPFNKYVYIGFALMMIGFFTLPLLIGLFIMPFGIAMFILGLLKASFDAGKKGYSHYQKLKDIFKK